MSHNSIPEMIRFQRYNFFFHSHRIVCQWRKLLLILMLSPRYCIVFTFPSGAHLDSCMTVQTNDIWNSLSFNNWPLILISSHTKIHLLEDLKNPEVLAFRTKATMWNLPTKNSQILLAPLTEQEDGLFEVVQPVKPPLFKL